MVVKEKFIDDLSYADYNLRQEREITPDQIEFRAANVKPANQFVYKDGYWTPNEYEGFAIVSMVNNNPGNDVLSEKLQVIQHQLMGMLDETVYFLLPPESFHQTIANTLSAERFKENIGNVGKEAVYPSMVDDAFQQIYAGGTMPIRMKLIGLSIFSTAIGILGVIESENDYRRITTFRSNFYANKNLQELDVKLTRPFIGHISLAYIERELTLKEKDELAKAVNSINADLLKNPLEFLMSHTELRRYHHLAEFISQEHYPVFHFTN